MLGFSKSIQGLSVSQVAVGQHEEQWQSCSCSKSSSAAGNEAVSEPLQANSASQLFCSQQQNML